MRGVCCEACEEVFAAACAFNFRAKITLLDRKQKSLSSKVSARSEDLWFENASEDAKITTGMKASEVQARFRRRRHLQAGDFCAIGSPCLALHSCLLLASPLRM